MDGEIAKSLAEKSIVKSVELMEFIDACVDRSQKLSHSRGEI